MLHLGYATSAVDTVQPIPIPDTVPDNDPTGDADRVAEWRCVRRRRVGWRRARRRGHCAAARRHLGHRRPTPRRTLTDPVASSSGLPPLFSIPGLLLFAGLGGALLAGSYVRRIGALVLGAGGACPHGLESGLPDLRKVQ